MNNSTTTHDLNKEELAYYGELLKCELPKGSYLKISTSDGKHDQQQIFSGDFKLIGYTTIDGEWVNVNARGTVNTQNPIANPKQGPKTK